MEACDFRISGTGCDDHQISFIWTVHTGYQSVSHLFMINRNQEEILQGNTLPDRLQDL